MKKLCYILAGFIVLLMLLIVVVGAAAYVLQPKIKQVLNQVVETQIEQRLPETFSIKKWELDWSWVSLLKLQPLELVIELTGPDLKLFARGPLTLAVPHRWLIFSSSNSENTFYFSERKPEDLQINYRPDFEITHFSKETSPSSLKVNGGLHLEAIMEWQNKHIRSLKASGNLNDFFFQNLQIKALNFQWIAPDIPTETISTDASNAFFLPDMRLKAELDEIQFEALSARINSQTIELEFNITDCSLQGQVSAKDTHFSNNKSLKVEIQQQTLALTNPQACRAKLDSELVYRASNFSLESEEHHLQLALGELTGEGLIEKNHSDMLQSQWRWSPSQLEVLKEDLYFSPPIDKHLITTSLEIENSDTGDQQINQIELQLAEKASPGRPWLSTRAQWKDPNTQSTKDPDNQQPILIDFSLQQSFQNLRELAPTFSTLGWEIEANVHTNLKLLWDKTGWQLLPPSHLNLAPLEITHLELKHKSSHEFKAQYHHRTRALIEVNSKELRQLNLEGSLINWKVPLKIERGRAIIEPTPIPIQVQGLTINMKPLSGIISWQQPRLSYDLITGLKLEPVSLKRLSQKLCIDPEITPSGRLSLNYSTLKLTENQLLSEGKGRLDVFGGSIHLSDFEIDQLVSAAPITRLSANWEELDLSLIGDFTQFGGMIGTARGHLKNLTFLGTLLRDYDFLFQLKPAPNKSKFYFSRRATNNLIQIFAQGQGLDQGPTGTLLNLSGRILGDYGIQYAGLRAQTQNNFVLLETFDPPEVVKREGQRFLLYGARIKMPLSTRSYPLILSQNGWNGFVYYFRDSLLNLMGPKATPERERVCLPMQPEES